VALYRRKADGDPAPLLALLDEIAAWAPRMKQGVIELLEPPEPERDPLAPADEGAK
jgi:hypothetical protein